jgi:hypothetical protein
MSGPVVTVSVTGIACKTRQEVLIAESSVPLGSAFRLLGPRENTLDVVCSPIEPAPAQPS